MSGGCCGGGAVGATAPRPVEIQFFFGERVPCGPDLPIGPARKYLSPARLADRGAALREQSLDAILGVLARTGELLTDPKAPYRGRIMESMPGVTGYSPAMVERGLEVLKALLSREVNEGRLASLGDPRALDRTIRIGRRKAVRALPLGSVCCVAAGNIYIGSIDALVLALITKNAALLKISRSDPVFPFLFLEALEEADSERILIPSVAVAAWSRNNREVIAHVKNVFDGILLFGGAEAVAEWKRDLGPRTELLAFGPKVSFGLVRSGLSAEERVAAAKGFALDSILWEQRACTSCQNVFVEGGPEERDAFAALLASALEEACVALPAGRPDLDEAVEIRKERELAFHAQTKGEARLFEGPGWTVIARGRGNYEATPLNRTVCVTAFGSLDELARGNLPALGRGMLSTAGIASPPERYEETEEALFRFGVERVCLPGTMGLGADLEGAHDGRRLTELLMRIRNQEDIPRTRLGLAWASPERRERFLTARLDRLLDHARRSPFHAERLASVPRPLPSLRAYAETVPILEKADLEAHPPFDDPALLTRDPMGAYLFESGGTGGRPRHVVWTPAELEASSRVTGEGFQVGGIGPGDRVANLLRAGALWTGFLAFDRGLEETGAEILSMTFNHVEADLIAMLSELRPNVILGMTSALLALGRAAEEAGHPLTIERIGYTGEPLPPSSRDFLGRAFRCDAFFSPLYGAVEIGPQGWPCPHCPPGVFHVSEEWALTEIADGEIFATALERTLHPFLRYRVGDAAEWIPEPCPCGRTAPRFRLLGRSGDHLRIHFGKLYLSEVEAAMAPFRELSGAFQVRVEGLEERAKVTFRIEAAASGGTDPALAERVRGSILETARAYRDPRNWAMEDLIVEILPPGTIDRVPRTGKIRRIDDRRVG
jgi:phenylacetate-coenzyme A ligase PaaK-like adenylate-forming protein